MTLTIPRALHDDRYPLENGTGVVSIDFKAGKQHLDGHRALMYARSRHQDSDYGRMRRQQAVLLALRNRLKPCKLIPKVPTLLKIARDDAWTSFKPKDLPSLLSLAATTDAKHVKTMMFAPPAYPETISDSEIKQIRTVVRGIFPSHEPDRRLRRRRSWHRSRGSHARADRRTGPVDLTATRARSGYQSPMRRSRSRSGWSSVSGVTPSRTVRQPAASRRGTSLGSVVPISQSLSAAFSRRSASLGS